MIAKIGSKKTITAWVTFCIVACSAINLTGTALADDWYWHNDNGTGDNKWENPCYWDRFLGGCGAFVNTCVTSPTYANGWVIIKTTGDGDSCDPPRGEPEAAAGDGPIVDADTVTAIGNPGAWALIVNNNLQINEGGSVRSRAWTNIGSAAGTTGVINVNGGSLRASDGYINNGAWRHLIVGSYGNGTINLSSGEVRSRGYRIFVGRELGSVGVINVSGGYLQCGQECRVGNEGSGTLNQTGGLIEVTGAGWEITAYNNSSINLNGGECYSNDVPMFGEAPDSSAMYIDGGKLRVSHSSAHETEINDLITSGKIIGTGGSTNPNDGNWKIAVVPEIASKYGFDTLTIQSPVPPCEINAIPYKEQSLELGFPATDDVVYTITNEGVNSINYAVEEVDDTGNPTDYAWLSLDKTGGGPIAGSPDGKSGGTDTVTATIDTSTLTPGQSYTAYLEFTEDCSTAVHTRSISVLVKRWDIDPPEPTPAGGHNNATDASIVAYLNCINPQTYTYTITNLSDSPLSYTVQETDAGGAPSDYTWIDLDKTSGGPIAPGASDTLTVTLTGTGDGPEVISSSPDDSCTDCRWDGYLTFTNDQSEVLVRQIQMDETWLGGLFGHVREYRGDVPPNDPLWIPGADGPCGPGCNFQIIGTQTGTVVVDNASVDPDYNAQNRFAFKIDEPPGPDPVGRNGYASDVNMDVNGGNNNNFNSRIGTTMVARIKCLRDTLMGANLWIRDNNDGSGTNEPFGAGCRARWNASNTIYDFVNDAGPVTAGTGKADAYHVIRIIDGWGPYGKHMLKIWVDEDQFPDPALEVSDAIPEGENQYDAFCFGTYGGSSNSEVYYDWITFTNAGMYAPGEEESCLGRSMIPEFCNDPFADADGDEDVDQDDFAAFQLCYTGPGGGVPDGCDCFDNDADGDIDTTDLGDFENCASGPAVPADKTCDDPAP